MRMRRDIGQKIRRFEHTLPLFAALVRGGLVGILPRFSALENSSIGLSYRVVCVIVCYAVLVQCRLVMDRQTDKRTDEDDPDTSKTRRGTVVQLPVDDCYRQM